MGLLFVVGRGGREIAIGQTLLEYAPGDLAMEVEPFRLPVQFIPTEIEPFQAFEDGVERGLRVAVDVGVVNTQNHRSVMAARIEPVENKCSGAADVQEAGWGGREADTKHQSSGYLRLGTFHLDLLSNRTRGVP